MTSFAVDDPAVKYVFSTATEEVLAHDAVIGDDYARCIELRLRLRTELDHGKPLYLCAECGAPVYLISQSHTRRFHFRHSIEDGRCTALTRGELNQREIMAKQYDGLKEGEQHRALKRSLQRALEADARFDDVKTEANWKGTDARSFRRPDVAATFNGIRIAFEIQLSTTFLNVIAARRWFYQKEGGLLFWVFSRFDDGERRLLDDDVFYNNNRNAFLLTKDAIEASIRQRALQLECVWMGPTDPPNAPLRRRIVDFAQLQLDTTNQRAYYFDFVGAKRSETERIADKSRIARQAFEDWWLSAPRGEFVLPDVGRYPALIKLAKDAGAQLPFFPTRLPRALLNMLYSAKYGQVVGWGFKTLVEVAHCVAGGHKQHLQIFRLALRMYGRIDQIEREDKSGKLRAKAALYRAAIEAGDPGYAQSHSDDTLIAFLFPELFQSSTSDSA